MTNETKPVQSLNNLHRCALEVASWGNLRRMYPQFTVQMHDEVLDRLLYLDCMRHAWYEMNAELKGLTDTKLTGRAYGFFNSCLNAFMSYLLVEVRPIAAHRKHYEKLAQAALTLVEHLRLDIDLATAAIGSTYPNRNIESYLSAFAERCGVNSKTAEDIGRASYMYAAQNAPHLEDVLERLAEDAKNLAKAGPLSTRPNKEDAAEIYFVRCLSTWLREEFKRPMHAVAASAANALFASDIDADRVQRLTNRNW